MQQPKSKVLFILPSYSETHATHYPYWYELIEKVGKKLDVVVLFESGKFKPTIKNTTYSLRQKITMRPFNLLERLWLMMRFVNQGYTNIYIHYSYWSVFLAKLLSILKPIKIYYWNCEEYDRKPKDRLLPLALKWCDVLVTGSDGIAKAYRNLFHLKNKKIKIVPNWVREFQVPAKKLAEGKTHILFVHHLSPRKGSHDLPEIVKDTVKIHPKVHFHIVGSGPDEEWLRAQVTSNKLQDSVSFYGSLPLKEVASLYKAVDYFIMPSLSEGFPRVILEAMIYKLPFVSTNVGCVDEIISNKQRPFLVEPGNANQFVDTLLRLVRSKDKSSIIEENYNKAKEYTKEKAAQALLEVF